MKVLVKQFAHRRWEYAIVDDDQEAPFSRAWFAPFYRTRRKAVRAGQKELERRQQVASSEWEPVE